jgi:hypothetical protein
VAGVFTHAFATVLEKTPNATFKDLEEYTKKNIQKYQNIDITTSDASLLKDPILADAFEFN